MGGRTREDWGKLFIQCASGIPDGIDIKAVDAPSSGTLGSICLLVSGESRQFFPKRNADEYQHTVIRTRFPPPPPLTLVSPDNEPNPQIPFVLM